VRGLIGRDRVAIDVAERAPGLFVSVAGEGTRRFAAGVLEVGIGADGLGVGGRRAGYDYDNLAETRSEANRVLPRASYRRLRAIKATYDPDEAIISTHPVRPAGIGR
jgi:hypothetical protein